MVAKDESGELYPFDDGLPMKESAKIKDRRERLYEVQNLIAARKGTEAIEFAEKLMKEFPDNPDAYFLLGLFAFSQDNFGDAIELFKAAHDRDSDCREYADCLAILYTVIGKLSDGLYFAKLSTALESDPDILPFIPKQLSNYFEALDRIQPTQHFVNALMLYNSRRLDDAVRSCELELKQNDRHDPCTTLLGKCHLGLGNYAKAASALHAAQHLNPANAENSSLLGSTLCHLGRFDEAVVCHKMALERDPDSVGVAAAALLDAEFLPDYMDSVRAGLRDELNKRINALERFSFAKQEIRAEKPRLRVGYLSNAFYNTEQARFVSALLANHDRGRFEIYCYQQSIAKDSVRVDLQNHADSWREIYDIQDPVMEMIVNGDEIDVLVDLCGYTAENRAGLIATRPAPVQIGLLEPPFGVDAPGIDIVISDPITHRTDTGAVRKGQGVVTIETGVYALEPFTLLPPVGELPARSAGRLVFGGHCDLAQLTPETAALWSRVLGATGRSKLLLGDVGAVAGNVKNHVIDLFGHFGMSDRIIFWDEPTEDRQKIEFFRQIDVLLDTYPLNGRLSVCKALWMGVPVLTLKGSRRVSQVGASLLNAAGQAAWICETADDMVERAKSFAGDLDGLAATRSALRDKVAQSDLFTPKRVVEKLEAIYLAAAQMARRKDGAAAATGRTKKRVPPKRTPAPRRPGGRKKSSAGVGSRRRHAAKSGRTARKPAGKRPKRRK